MGPFRVLDLITRINYMQANSNYIVCTTLLYLPTIPTHYTYPLYLPTIPTHYTYPLYLPTIPTHYTYPLYLPTFEVLSQLRVTA